MWLKKDERNCLGYMKTGRDGVTTLTGVAGEQMLIEIDNRLARACYHLVSLLCAITGSANVTLKCYGSFDQVNWHAIYIAKMPNPTIGAASLVITSGNFTGLYEAQVWNSGVDFMVLPCHYPHLKWTVTEAGTGSAGTIATAASGV